jgi:hypothetical protein
MRICEINDTHIKLNTRMWCRQGKPKVVGCENLLIHEPFEGVDWTQETRQVLVKLSRSKGLLKRVCDYIRKKTKEKKYEYDIEEHIPENKAWDVMDYAFCCGWTKELEPIQEKVEEIREEEDFSKELDAKQNKEVLLEDNTEEEPINLKNLKFNQNGQAGIKEEDKQVEQVERGEAEVVQDVGHSTSEKSEGSSELDPQRTTKRKRKKRRS